MEMTGAIRFATLLHSYRAATGLTQEELAERAGLSTRAISDLERGVRGRPQRETLAMLAQALDLSAEQRTLFEAVGRGRPLASSVRQSPEPTPRDNLPLEVTSFVGRAEEVAALQALLAETRLLTLVGTGGVGKTRLALRVAAELVDQYPDGVWLVELAPLADPALAPQAVATVLGLRETPGQPLRETLQAALRERRLLLVLDNCEHLIAACAELAEALLRRCPQVQILATSREHLGIAGEMTWRAPSLALPDLGNLPPLEVLGDTEAVRLFVERTRTVKPHFAVTEQNAAAVVQVCQRLDGIPLALELAAARLHGLTVADLAARLDQCFRLLTGGSRTALPRQQTLQATLDWSYALLNEPEQLLFARLSVFAGGFPLEAAETVGVGGELVPEGVLELLLQLVAKSLVQAEEGVDGETRYRLLETLRQYGRERLARQDDASEVRQRHATYCLALAESAALHLRDSTQLGWLARLEALRDDLRAAWRWYLDSGVSGDAVRLWLALNWYWYLRHPSEGQDWSRDLLALPALMGRARARTLADAGAWAFAFGSIREGFHLVEEGLALSRQLGDEPTEGFALYYLGSQSLNLDAEGAAEQARAWLEQALVLQRRWGDQWEVGRVLGDLTLAACAQGDLAATTESVHELMAIARDLQNVQLQAIGLDALGFIAATAGDAAEATRQWEEAIALYRELGDGLGIATSEGCLGCLAIQQGRYAEGQEHILAKVHHLYEQGVLGWTLQPLYWLALCAEAAGDVERGLRLAAAILACYEAAGYRMLAEQRETLERLIATARSELGEQAAATVWAEGQAMTLAQAVAYALTDRAQ